MIVTFLPNTGKATAFENRVAPECMNDFTFDELFDFLLDNVIATNEKSDGHFIIPVEFKTNDYLFARDSNNSILYKNNGEPYIQRAAENVRYVTLMPADIDDGMSLEEAKERFKQYSYIIYTSFNHMADGTTPKFRMFFPLAEAVTPDDIRIRKKALHGFLGAVDKTTLYISRGFYTPTIRKGGEHVFYMDINYGITLDVMKFDAIIPAPYRPSMQELSDKEMQEIKNELRRATIPSYERWWQMVQAMKSCGYSETDVMDVSANNSNHTSPSTGIKDAAQCSTTYNNVRGSNGGMGKLVTLIREGGYPEFRQKGIALTSKRDSLALQLEILKREKLIRMVADGEQQ